MEKQVEEKRESYKTSILIQIWTKKNNFISPKIIRIENW